METLVEAAQEFWRTVIDAVTGPWFGVQATMAAAAVLAAFLIGLLVRKRARVFKTEPKPGPFLPVRTTLYRTRNLLFPAICVILLGIAVEIGVAISDQSWLVRSAQGAAVVYFLYRVITDFIESPLISRLLMWVFVPIATLRVFGLLDEVSTALDGVSFEIGTIRVSLLLLARTVIAGGVLFWLGSLSNKHGQQAIRNRHTLDVGTREVAAKLFQIGLVVVVFLLLLGAMGINLTALTVFGGALALGIGFGLQQIAANFVSGLIILADRSITIGDYVEFEGGRAGTIRELNMRSATLETFDGKDIMVPNEQFMTQSFVNWTHKNQKQRYALEFSVSYKTELHRMLEIVRDVVRSHPQVLDGPELPIEERAEAEIASFGDSGVNILVEFWMVGVDDGENHVGADLLLMIWDALKQHGIEIPFPQRDVRIVREE